MPHDDPTEVVRCPVHGFIRYSRNERAIIDDPVFQRLRHIRQLAMGHLVYPGAMHSRFEHSLGVMELVTQAFDALLREKSHRETLEKELRTIPELHENTLAAARQIARLLALLHDVGHPPFSHAGESTMPCQKHEEVSVYVIREVLGAQIDSLFFQGASELLVRLIEKPQEAPFLRQFVVGEMDMDRTDYLRRDSLHCGVDYGVFDFRRLIESLTLVENPDTGRLQLAIRRGGEHTFEALILARYQMNTQVYLHKIRRIYDHYLEEYLKLWAAEHYQSLADVLRYDDADVLVDIRQDAKANNERSPWARRIVSRQHHRVIYETGDSADLSDLQKARRLFRGLQRQFESVDFYLDDSPVSIYRLAVPGDQEDQKVEDLYIVEKNGRRKLLTHDSAIISKIPKSVRTVRIFADAEGEVLESVRERTRQLESTL